MQRHIRGCGFNLEMYSNCPSALHISVHFEGEAEKFRDNPALVESEKKRLETIWQEELDVEGTEEGVGLLRNRDYYYCPNKYLLKEHLCPAELPTEQPRERSCRNRTWPYREGGSKKKKSYEGAEVKWFPTIWDFHWHEPSEESPSWLTRLQARLCNKV